MMMPANTSMSVSNASIASPVEMQKPVIHSNFIMHTRDLNGRKYIELSFLANNL